MRIVQAVPVDKRPHRAEPDLVAFGSAVADALGARTQTWLAGELGIDGGHMSRIVAGKVGVALDMVVKIEDALGVGRGALLRAAGYVDDDSTVLGAITADRALTPEQKRTLRNVYELAINSTPHPRQR